MTETQCIYAIQNKLTGMFLKFGPKAGWSTKAGAANAFNLHMFKQYKDVLLFPNRYGSYSHKGLFDLQKDYELVKFGTMSGELVT